MTLSEEICVGNFISDTIPCLYYYLFPLFKDLDKSENPPFSLYFSSQARGDQYRLWRLKLFLCSKEYRELEIIKTKLIHALVTLLYGKKLICILGRLIPWVLGMIYCGNKSICTLWILSPWIWDSTHP